MAAHGFGLTLITVLLWSTGCGSGGASNKDSGVRLDADGGGGTGGAMEAAADGPADDGPVDVASDGAEARTDGGGETGGTGGVDGGGTDGVDASGDSVVDVGESPDGSGDGDAGVGTPEVSTFTAVPPCNSESDYVAGTTVFFAMNDARYSPKCLKLQRGGSVTFAGDGGGFDGHPLRASRKRGDRTMNPITDTNTGTMATFTFPNPGYFAYFCAFHGFSDTGTGSMMDGVVWVQ